MAILEIPLTAENASFKMRTTLEGNDYILRFDWNGRDGRWFMSIFDSEESPIVQGIPMHIDSSLIARFQDTRLPEGELMLYDTGQRHEEAGRDDLGERAILLYRESV